MTAARVARAGLLAALGAAAACSSAPAAPTLSPVPVPGTPARAAPSTTPGPPGGLRVRVRFEGAVPPARALVVGSDSFCMGARPVDDSLVVKDGVPSNVVVRIDEAVAGAWAVPPDPVEVVQSGCMYRPRVVTALGGQPVVIVNGDPTLHNVHGVKPTGATYFNRPQPAGTPPLTRVLEDGIYNLKCDVHPWMAGWVSSAPHPFNTVADERGEVRWDGIPSREKPYVVRVWHERLGERRFDVRIDPGVTSELAVSLGAPGP